MKRIAILQHAPFETAGCIEEWLHKKSYGFSITELYTGAPLPDTGSIDWLILMGGGMSVHDTDRHSWLSGEKRFIEKCIKSGKTVIGICLGSQLIAEVLGSRIYRNRHKEIGWFPVAVTEEMDRPALFREFRNNETVFHWHGDTFDLPANAKHMFRSEACENQCFIYDESVIGLQFHLEVTDKLLKGMFEGAGDEIVPGEFIQSEEEMLAGTCNIKRTNELMYSILNGLDKS